MIITLCDRCGRTTKNDPVFTDYNTAEAVTFCNNCLEDFYKFRYEHENFNKILDDEKEQ